MDVHPEALKRLREQKHWTQDRLAEAAGVSQRQIARIESGRVARPRTLTVRRLADALEVEVRQLLRPDNPQETNLNRQTDPQFEPKVPEEMCLFYDLIWMRYGVDMRDCLYLAPLMLALLAELSLKWRETLVNEVESHLERIAELSHCNGHRYFCSLYATWRDGLAEAEEAIKNGDLHWQERLQDSASAGADAKSLRNPFRDYLMHLAGQINKPEIVRLEGAKGYKICEGELRRITGGSGGAAQALESGRVRLTEIPAELMAGDALAERVAWLENAGRGRLAAEGGASKGA